jgi:hypothetical protein
MRYLSGGLFLSLEKQISHSVPRHYPELAIEIGEGLTAFALSHHLAYGTVPGGSYSRDTRFVMAEEEKQALLILAQLAVQNLPAAFGHPDQMIHAIPSGVA